MSEKLRSGESWSKERESRTHAIARQTLEAIGIAGFVAVVISNRWISVQPRRGNPAWSEAERRIHAGAAAARMNELLAFVQDLRDPAAPDPAALVRGREFYIGGDEEGLPNLVLLDLSLERMAMQLAKRLRSTRGLQLRRVEADAIACVLDGLAQRSLRSTRRNVA